MPRTGLSDISVVLDRSGSMEAIADDTIGSFNAFVADQGEEPGEARLSLVLFDDQYEPVHDAVPLAAVPRLSRKTFQPRGTTALLDAVGRTIVTTGARLAALNEADRPERVIFVIITDGMENSSREYTRDKVFAMISHQRDVYRWHFEFLAANQDAITTGATMGIPAADSLTFGTNAAGVARSNAAVSAKMRNFRRTGVAPAHSPQVRADSMGEPDGTNS